MVKRCVVGGCSNSSQDKVSVHQYPKEQAIRQKWDAFVKSTRKDWKSGNDHSIVCGAHFKAPDDFVGWSMYQAGYRRQLNLPGAIPSIRPKKVAHVSGTTPEPTPSASSAISDTPVPPKKRKSGAVRKLTVARVSVICVFS